MGGGLGRYQVIKNSHLMSYQFNTHYGLSFLIKQIQSTNSKFWKISRSVLTNLVCLLFVTSTVTFANFRLGLLILPRRKSADGVDAIYRHALRKSAHMRQNYRIMSQSRISAHKLMFKSVDSIRYNLIK